MPMAIRYISSGNDLEKVKQTLRQDFEIVAKWLYENYMVFNSGKCHFMYLRQNTVNGTFVYDNIEMKNHKEEILRYIKCYDIKQ